MAIEVITKEDLGQFRIQLLNDIRKLIVPSQAPLEKPWLRNAELKRLLNISSNTIQRLRVSGKLSSTKIGGIHYYKYEDIQTLMNNSAH